MPGLPAVATAGEHYQIPAAAARVVAVRPPYWSDGHATLYLGDAREVLAELPTGSADCIVTSPPYYGLRDYGAFRLRQEVGDAAVAGDWDVERLVRASTATRFQVHPPRLHVVGVRHDRASDRKGVPGTTELPIAASLR